MKNHLWEIILAVALAFFAAGVVGMVIEAVFHPTQTFWVFFWMALFGFVASLAIILRSYLYKVYEYLKSKLFLIWKVITHIKESNALLSLLNEQMKSPYKWLFPVIDHIDLNRQGGEATKNDAFVRFWIDSQLLFPMSEYYVFVKLCLRDESRGDFPEVEARDWRELQQRGNYPPILQLERHRFAEEKLHIEDGEGELLKMMAKARKNRRVLSTLKIGIAFRAEDKDNPICLEGSRWVTPMLDYRGE